MRHKFHQRRRRHQVAQPHDARHGPGRRRTYRTRLSRIRGGDADPVATAQGETADREVRSTAYQLKAARGPTKVSSGSTTH